MVCSYLGDGKHNGIMRNCVTQWNSANLLGMSGSPIGKKKGTSDRLIELVEFPEAEDQLLPWEAVHVRYEAFPQHQSLCCLMCDSVT